MPFERFIPRSFNAAAIREYAPEASGVYGISNSLEWIYIGETDNLRAALLELLGESKRSIPGAKATGFVFEVCDRAARPARQDRLILEYKPSGNQHSLRRS